MSKILSFNNKLLANPSVLKLLGNYEDLPSTYHTDTFNNCGTNTTTSLAELAQIPTNLK